jgi:hypothetical protein
VRQRASTIKLERYVASLKDFRVMQTAGALSESTCPTPSVHMLIRGARSAGMNELYG